MKLSLKEGVRTLFVCLFMASFSCSSSDDPQPEEPKDNPKVQKCEDKNATNYNEEGLCVFPEKKCEDENAINNGEPGDCKYPKTFSVGVSVIDTEFVGEISNGQLEAGTKYRSIVYKEDGSYLEHKDYTVGSTIENFSLANTDKYTIVVYSFGSTENLPEITDVEKGNISNATLDFDVNQGNLTYAKISDYVPESDGNVNVKLINKFSLITLSLNNQTSSPSVLSTITQINNVQIDNNQKGKISLSSGEITERTDSQMANITFSSNTFNDGDFATSTPVWVNIVGDDISYSYSITIERQGASQDMVISNVIGIAPGTKLNIDIIENKCGAYVSPTEFKEFACFNLGADNTADPLELSQAIYGDIYQWGRNSPSATMKQHLDPANRPEWTAGTWDGSNFPLNNWMVVNNGIFSKGSMDPCPTGYRLPSSVEFNQIFENNKVLEIGDSWLNPEDYDKLYGVIIGDRLLLPHTGWRNRSDGKFRFSNMANTSRVRYLAADGMIMIENDVFKAEPYIDGTNRGGTQAFGTPVRCIKE